MQAFASRSFDYTSHSLTTLVAAIILVGMASIGVLAGEAGSPPEELNVDSLVRQIDTDTYRIGRLHLNKTTRQVIIPGLVNMNKGLVEYLAVAPGGKTHESVLLLDAKPLHVQTALLLLGLDYGNNLAFQGDTTAPAGDSVSVDVRWVSATGDTVTMPATALLTNLHDSTDIPATPWVFTGSDIWNGKLLADVEGSIAATYSDPAAILNTPMTGRADDTMYGANEAVVPERGQHVWLIITALK